MFNFVGLFDFDVDMNIVDVGFNEYLFVVVVCNC